MLNLSKLSYLIDLSSETQKLVYTKLTHIMHTQLPAERLKNDRAQQGHKQTIQEMFFRSNNQYVSNDHTLTQIRLDRGHSGERGQVLRSQDDVMVT